jgi:hypothetical protein
VIFNSTLSGLGYFFYARWLHLRPLLALVTAGCIWVRKLHLRPQVTPAVIRIEALRASDVALTFLILSFDATYIFV